MVAPGDRTSLPIAPRPTRHAPGSTERIDVYAWRAAHGYSVFHPHDAKVPAAYRPRRRRGPDVNPEPQTPKYIQWDGQQKRFRVRIPAVVGGRKRRLLIGKYRSLLAAVKARNRAVRELSRSA